MWREGTPPLLPPLNFYLSKVLYGVPLPHISLCIVFRAIEVWGSWPALEAELRRRQTARDEEEKRRQGGCQSTVVVLKL